MGLKKPLDSRTAQLYLGDYEHFEVPTRPEATEDCDTLNYCPHRNPESDYPDNKARATRRCRSEAVSFSDVDPQISPPSRES